jgi:glycosyltransferase involved in cell wall biosynthesis
MRCPTLSELSLPPPGKTGWPWTEESPQLPATIPEPLISSGQVASWPRVSIVTPSYNQGQFIEETIRSVLLQGYPNLEYIIMDGGSTDDSVEIIRKYEQWLVHWESKRDKGQADAINQGFARSSGSIIAWINSDDTYEPQAVSRMVLGLLERPDHQIAHGDAWYVDESGHRLAKCAIIRPSFTFRYLLNMDPIVQPTSFWHKELWERVGPLRVDLNWGFDWEWYIRARRHNEFLFVPEHVANYRLHSRSKTQTRARCRERHAEIAHISRHHGGWFQPTVLMYMASVPSYYLEDILGELGLPHSIRNLVMGIAGVLPRLVGRLLKGYYQT